MSFLWTKKPPFEKKNIIKRQTQILFYRKVGRKIFGTYDQNHGLTSFKIYKFFNYSKMSLLCSTKSPFEKTTSSNDKPKVSCTEKWARKIFGSDDHNHGLTTF